MPILQQFAPDFARISAERFPHFSDLIRAAPLIDDQLNIYLSTVSTGHIYKFKPDGTQFWSYVSGAQLPGIPFIMDGKLFSATDKGEVFALDMATGKKLWSRHYSFSVAGDTWSTTAAEGVVIVPAVKGTKPGNNKLLAAFRASDGKHMWTFESEADLYNILVAIKDGSCVFSNAFGKVFRLDLQTGRTIWSTPWPKSPGFTTGGSVLGPDGQTVFTTWNENRGGPQGQEGVVGAYRFADGRRLWETRVHYEANNAPSVGVLGSGANARLAVVVGIGTNPAIPDPKKGILSGRGGKTLEARIIALDAATGEPRWNHELVSWHGAAQGDDSRPDICLPDAFSNVAIGGDGTVYVGFQDGNFYGVLDKDDNGVISAEEVTSYQTGAAFQGSPGIADGMVVATSCDGMHVWRSPRN